MIVLLTQKQEMDLYFFCATMARMYELLGIDNFQNFLDGFSPSENIIACQYILAHNKAKMWKKDPPLSDNAHTAAVLAAGAMAGVRLPADGIPGGQGAEDRGQGGQDNDQKGPGVPPGPEEFQPAMLHNGIINSRLGCSAIERHPILFTFFMKFFTKGRFKKGHIPSLLKSFSKG